ncbi:MAG TPA: hypothetical protein VHU40_06935 [Polyangia bacterium]|nr:hypothetical protein [Polyangia bacterium]
MVVVGDDLTCEVAARSLSAAGVGSTRFVRRDGPLSDVVLRAMVGSNPDARVETRAWPSDGAGWVEALAGATAVVRSGFDDDAMLRAAVRLGVPVVVARVQPDVIDVMSFRKHGPCPHASLDVPEVIASTARQDGAASVVAAQMVAAEILMLLVDEDVAAGPRARHTRLPLDGEAPRTVTIPWTPECFACGGTATEMSF